MQFDNRTSVIREQNHKVPILIDVDDIEAWRTQHDNFGLFTSIFQYDSPVYGEGDCLSNLYFDLDGIDVQNVQYQAQTLVDYLLDYVSQDALRIYFSGLKGFHLECEALALGISPAPDLAELFRFIANSIQEKLNINCFDTVVYDTRRMWRLANSRHQKSQYYKIPLTINELLLDIDQVRELASAPRILPIPPQKREAKADSWYHEWQYLKEETKQFDPIERFLQYGSMETIDDKDLIFTPGRLLENCKAVGRLWRQAEETHDLPHEARLFLLSLLSYTDDAQWYLHEILKECYDYDPVVSQAHIDDWIKRRNKGIGGRPFTCKAAASMGVGCSDCNLEPRHKWETVGDRLVQTNETVDPSPKRWAYKRRSK